MLWWFPCVSEWVGFLLFVCLSTRRNPNPISRSSGCFASSHKSITRVTGWLSCFGIMTARGRGYWCYVGLNGNRISNTECSTSEKCSPNYLKASGETIFVSRRQMWLGEPSEVIGWVYQRWREKRVWSYHRINPLQNKLFCCINIILGLCLLTIPLCLLLHSSLNSKAYRSTELQ